MFPPVTATEVAVAASTVTDAVWVIVTPPAVAVIVFTWASVELKFVVKTPLPLVDPDAGLKVLFAPLDAIVTAALGTRLLKASRAVTVIVDAVEPATQDVRHAAMGDVARATLEVAALGAAGFTTTVAVCVIVTVPFTSAVTVFVCAAVELIVPVIWPLLFVVPTGCVIVLLVPVADNVTVCPPIGLLNASRTVTVMVDVLAPLLAVIGDVADTDD